MHIRVYPPCITSLPRGDYKQPFGPVCIVFVLLHQKACSSGLHPDHGVCLLELCLLEQA